eukprot:545206_1
MTSTTQHTSIEIIDSLIHTFEPLNKTTQEDDDTLGFDALICDLPAIACHHILALKQVITNYSKHTTEDNISEISAKFTDSIVDIINDFHHLLLFHDKDDKEFQSIYNLFAEAFECNADKCKTILRHYRNREKDFDSCLSVTNIFMEDILNQIHCHIYHQYDIGFRLTDTDKQQINETIGNNDDQKIDLKQNSKFIKLKKMLQERYSKLQKISTSYRTLNNNKFATDLNKTTLNINEKKENDSMFQYSYSFPFMYKEKFRNEERQIGATGLKYCDLYVTPKFSSLKEELISNNICKINITLWNGLTQTVSYLIQTQNAKMSTANTYTRAQKESIAYKHIPSHPMNFGYKDGDEIKRKHLIAIRAYCVFDKLQFEFSTTFRKINGECLRDVVERHSNFYHFGKNIKEAVEVFGTTYVEGHCLRMYHGINKEMLFDEMSALIHGPLSTSSEYHVALNFSNFQGQVLELVPNHLCKYFICNWISTYSNENELLFCGGVQKVDFVNILNVSTGADWIKYVKTLRIISEMSEGLYCMDDPSDFKKWHEFVDKESSNQVEQLGLSPLDENSKKLCWIMVCHQITKNGYVDTSKQQIKLYPKIMNQVPYIERLFTNICNKKKWLIINMKAMKTDNLKQCSNDDIGGYGGYLGYSFMRSLFVVDEYEGINLTAFHALFPNLTHIFIAELVLIHDRFLDDICLFLSKNVSAIYYVALALVKDVQDPINVKAKCDSYQPKYKSIGFELEFVSKNDIYGTTEIVIRNRKYGFYS